MNNGPKDTSLYDTLGVTDKADSEEIKKAFRKMALKWHPDKWVNASDVEKKTAEENFKKLTEAYTILNDPNKREQYNRFGLDAVRNAGQGHQMSPEDLQEMFAGMGFPFGGMGGGFSFPGMGQRRGRPAEPTMPHLEQILQLDMKQIYLGSTVEFEVVRYNLKKLTSNNKTLTKEDFVCDECKGAGMKMRVIRHGPGMMQQVQEACFKCESRGIVFPEAFFDKKSHKFSKIIPHGIMQGEKIIIENKGHEIPECFKDKFPDKERTNIILTISEQREYVVTSDKDKYKYVRGVNNNPFNLALDLIIEPQEFICGGYKNIPFINGKTICIKIPQGIAFKKSNNVVIVPGSGMPLYKKKDKFGDMFVIITVSDAPILSEGKLKKIWTIYTDKNMTTENDKIIKKANGNIIDALSMDDYNNRSNNGQNGHSDDDYSHSDDGDNYGRQSNMGGQPQCVQQ